MKKNILLVAPHDDTPSFWRFAYILKIEGKKNQGPPLALLLIAAMLPAERYEVKLIDMGVTDLTDADLAWADMVFLSGLTTCAASMAQVLRRAKAAGRSTVFGGPHASVAYSSMADVDCFVLGEAELVWDVFLADLDAGALKNAYAAPVSETEKEALLSHFGSGAVLLPADVLPDLGSVPVPRFDLLDMNAYLMIYIQTMRGCPSQCEFCDIWRRYGRRVRTRPVEMVLAELDELYRLGWRGRVLFANDNLIGDRGYAKELLTAVARWQTEHGRPFTFSGEASLNLAEDPELIELFMAAEVMFVFLGLETPHTDSLREVRKLTNLKGDMRERVRTLQEGGIQVAAGLIVGFDSDPPDVVNRIASAVLDMAIPFVMISMLTALPDTVLAERLQREGRLYSGIWLTSNDGAFIPNFQTVAPPAQVASSYRAVLNALYSNDMQSYFERCAVFLERRGKKRRKLRTVLAQVAPGAKRRVPAADSHSFQHTLSGKRILAVCRALFSPYAGNALRFLARIRRTRPGKIKAAVSLVIQGHHLWKMTRVYLEAAALWDAMRDELVALYRKFGREFPASTRLLGTWHPSHELPRATSPAVPATASQCDVPEIPASRKEEVKKDLLKDMDRRYRRLSREARKMLASEFVRFREDVQAV